MYILYNSCRRVDLLIDKTNHLTRQYHYFGEPEIFKVSELQSSYGPDKQVLTL